MRNARIQTIVEIALSVALAAVLNMLALRLPVNVAGGSVSLTMLPVAILALRRGPWAGAATGALFGLLDLLMEPFILVPAQVLLDYPLPYLVFGWGVGQFAVIYARLSSRNGAYMHAKRSANTSANTSANSREDSRANSPTDDARASYYPQTSSTTELGKGSALIIFALFVGGCCRYACHVFSGVLFFAEYAEGQNVWLYSLVYNVSYLAPSLIASLALTLLLMPILNRAVAPEPAQAT